VARDEFLHLQQVSQHKIQEYLGYLERRQLKHDLLRARVGKGSPAAVQTLPGYYARGMEII